MKKIININLSGRVIPIEDTAYEKLQAYIESLRRYFSHEDGRDEIINDIESRIAELMNEKIRKGASCIVDADIEEIAASMGRPEDFEAEAADAAESTGTSQQSNARPEDSYTTKKSRGRLYRDSSDKFIGGVCSGIAAYMNVDPAIVRILFAIITFGGFGLGFLAYIILWIVLPPKDLEGYRGKRLYRNPDDKVIGGVAGGLAAYFNKSATTIRLIFAAPVVFSMLFSVLNWFSWDYDLGIALNIGFGSLSGTFIMIYVILWMVLPEAHSPYEKMEMRGEKVDVNSIRQNVQEGMGTMKDRMKSWGEEVKESAQNLSEKAKEFAGTRGRAFASEVSDVGRNSGRGLGHAIGVIFKAFFLFIAGTIAFGLFVALIAIIFGGAAWWPINNFLWTSKWQQIYAWGTFIFFLVVPLVGFITWVIRRITKVRSKSNYLGWTFGFLWTLGWISLMLFITSMGKDFRREETEETPVSVVQPASNKMIVAVSQPELDFTGSFGWMDFDDESGWDLTNDTMRLSMVRVQVRPSTDSAYHVTIKKISHGRSAEDAMERAKKIQYSIISRDSVLDLGNGYAIDKDSKFRGQRVEVEIQVPVGKKIRFDESVREKLNGVNVRVKKSKRRDRVVGITVDDESRHFRYRSNIDYTMGINGELKSDDGENLENSNDYRYKQDSDTYNESKDIQDQINDEKRRKEEQNRESEQRIKDLEEQQKKIKQQQKPSTTAVPVGKTEDAGLAGGPTPVFSIVHWL